MHAARERPSQRRALHRPHLQAQAFPRDQEIRQGGEAGNRRSRIDAEAGRQIPMSLRLIFMGTPEFAVPALLEILGRGHEVAAVYTAAAKPAGRGMEQKPSAVEREARRFGLPGLPPKTLRTPEAAGDLPAHAADAGVAGAYSLLLPTP